MTDRHSTTLADAARAARDGFHVPHCTCSHALGDHQGNGAGFPHPQRYGLCRVAGCECREFVETLPTFTDPAEQATPGEPPRPPSSPAGDATATPRVATLPPRHPGTAGDLPSAA